MRKLLVLAVLTACSHKPQVGEVRYKNQPPVWAVNDRMPFPKAPKEREYNRALYHADGFVFRRTTRAMEMRPQVRAQDVNALDEVRDSTWFTNRIGIRDLSIDELERGANVGPSPFDARPWTITGAKDGGLSLGYQFEDATGQKYILKFDNKDEAEMETGAHAIVHRILWAIGYNVPEDHIGYVRREDLVVGPKALKKGYSEQKLDAALERVHRTEDGRIRVLASKYLPGTPIGPYAREGTRPDDPNDVIPHENRRSLRGQRSIFAWLNHSDMQEDQTMDVFTKDNFVVHYLLDFGKALGVMGHHMKWQTVGHTYRLDVGKALQHLVTFGLAERNWDGLRSPGLRGIGLFDAEHYSPGAWRPNSQYWPIEDADRHDAFWGAKLIMRFTREQLAAIVGQAQYSDPRASQYMLDTLIARQRATAKYWFDRVAPLDAFSADPDGDRVRLCFTDLTLAYELRRVATRYLVDAYDHAGKRLGFERMLGATPNGRSCVHGVELAAGRDAYTIVRLRVRRNAHEMPPVVVHVARDASGRPQVIGLRRR